MRKRNFLLAGIVLLLVFSPSTQAGVDELDELKQQLSELQDRITQLEGSRKLKDESLPENVDEESGQETDAIASPESIKWVERIKISGDLRYRHDHTDFEEEVAGGTRWRNGSDRHRIRARLMLEAMINEDWDVGLRVASGSSNTPNSTNQDLEDAFSSKDLWLDLAYFNWHPETEERLSVFGGKMANPFYRAGKNELIWDSDLNPEGIAAQYALPLSDLDQVHLNGGGFWVDESTLDVDTSLWGIQAYWKHTTEQLDYVLAGVSYYDYGNLRGRSALSSSWSSLNFFFGNSSSGGLYTYDYDIFEAFGERGFKCGGMPTAVFGSWVQNSAARSSIGNTGWLAGIKLNKVKEPGSWQFAYDYRELEADAVVGGFTESDFLGSVTDSRGHKLGLKYQLAKNLQLGLVYYHLEDTGSGVSDLDFRKLLGDLILKF
jgi:hypothetical protein